MRTYTKDSIPWRLRTEGNTKCGALSPDEVTRLSHDFDLDPLALGQLSIQVDTALSANLSFRQLELIPMQARKGADEVKVAIKALRDAEAKLQQAAETLSQLRFKHLFSNTGMPNQSSHHLELFYLGTEAVGKFRHYVETMARNDFVAFTGHPDKRKISDLRRNLVCVAIFNLWIEHDRRLTYTSDLDTWERGGRLVEFVNAVVECITDPPSRLDGDAIRREIEWFKSFGRSD